MRPEKVDGELWVINPIDDNPKSADQSGLPQIGGTVIKGDLQMMTFPYFLRRSTRRRGSKYVDAADNLVNMCSEVGMPEEAKLLIMTELDEVLSMINDDALKLQTAQRLGVLPAENVVAKASDQRDSWLKKLDALQLANRKVTRQFAVRSIGEH